MYRYKGTPLRLDKLLECLVFYPVHALIEQHHLLFYQPNGPLVSVTELQ